MHVANRGRVNELILHLNRQKRHTILVKDTVQVVNFDDISNNYAENSPNDNVPDQDNRKPAPS